MRGVKKIIGSLIIMALIVTGIPNECFASGVFNLPSDTIEMGRPTTLKNTGVPFIKIQFNDSLDNDITEIQQHVFFETYNYDKSLNGTPVSYRINIGTTTKTNDTIVISFLTDNLQNNYPYFVLITKGIKSASGDLTTKSYVRLYTCTI